MKINIHKVKSEIGFQQDFNFVTSPDDFVLNGERLWTNGDITVQGKVDNNGQDLLISGTIITEATCQCDRCLKKFVTNIAIPFSEKLRESDLNEKEMEVIRYQDNEVDITNLIYESILLFKPLKFLCSEKCRGLCLKCGTDLNTSQCSCEKEDLDPRLASLKKLLQDK